MEEQQEQESSGKQLRQEFWQAMWLPLMLYLIAGYDMEMGYALYITAEAICIVSWNFFERNATFEKWTSCVFPYSTVIYLLSPVGRTMINMVCFRRAKVVEDWLEEAGPIEGWEDLMISAAIVFRIVHYFLLSRTVEKTPKKTLAIHTVFWLLMAATVYRVHDTITTSGEPQFLKNMKFEHITHDFTNASLVTLSLCALVLYLGLSSTRTTVLVCLLVVLFLPIFFITMVLVMWRIQIGELRNPNGSYQALATDCTRFYRTCVGIFLAIGLAVEPLWNRRPE